MSPDGGVVRKVSSDGSQNWIISLSVTPDPKSLSVNKQETTVYFASQQSPIHIYVLNADTGSINHKLYYSDINGYSNDVRTHPFSDGTGFYLISKSLTTNSPTIYKWSNSDASTVTSQTITNFQEFAFGQYMLSDSELFFFGIDSLSDLHFYKVTIGNTAVDWASKLTCPTSTCVLKPSETQLSSDSSKLYIIAAYGNPKNLYFLELKVSDGSKVDSWYKSNQSEFSAVSGSALMGDYIAASIVFASTTTTYNLVLQNLISSEFKIYEFSGTIIYGL